MSKWVRDCSLLFSISDHKDNKQYNKPEQGVSLTASSVWQEGRMGLNQLDGEK